MTVAKRNGRTPEMTTLTTNSAEETEKKDRNLTEIDQVICGPDDDIKLEDLAPDGGWGWMVALAMIIVLVCE